MAERNRKTLKNFFRAGGRPTDVEFGDLIDSMVHKQEEGFRKMPAHGLMITAPLGYDKLISFYRNNDASTPLWSLGFTDSDKKLVFESQPPPGTVEAGEPAAVAAPPVLTIDQGGRVGVNMPNPVHALDVGGLIRSRGRIGITGENVKTPPVANEKWQDITGALEGGQVLEVVAATGQPGKGRHAMMHAIALNTHNATPHGRGPLGLFGLLDWLMPRCPIKQTSAYYGRRCDKLQLRWAPVEKERFKYKLQIRSRCDYGLDDPQQKAPEIRYSITQLLCDGAPTA